MFQPDKDLSEVWRRLSQDDTLKELLGLTGQPPETVAERIIKRKAYEDLAGSEKRLCIYYRRSRSARNQIVTEEVLQVDCHVPAAEDYIAYRVIERVKTLLHDKPLYNRYLHFDGQLGELPSMPGFVCVGVRFVFYVTI